MIRLRRMVPEDWQLWKDLRLRMLEDYPIAFTESLAHALRNTDAQWQEFTGRTGGKNSVCILAMDENNYAVLRQRAPAGYRERVKLFLEFAPDCGMSEVPDPYYGGPAGFEQVLDLVEEAARGLISHLRTTSRAA